MGVQQMIVKTRLTMLITIFLPAKITDLETKVDEYKAKIAQEAKEKTNSK